MQCQGLGGPFPLCDGATSGELRSGYLAARRASEGAVLSEEGYREFLIQRLTAADPAASDEYGPGEWRLFSPEFIAALGRMQNACSELQGIARDNSIDLDLTCG